MMLRPGDPIYHILEEYHKATPYVEELTKTYNMIAESNGDTQLTKDEQIILSIFGEEEQEEKKEEVRPVDLMQHFGIQNLEKIDVENNNKLFDMKRYLDNESFEDHPEYKVLDASFKDKNQIDVANAIAKAIGYGITRKGIVPIERTDTKFTASGDMTPAQFLKAFAKQYKPLLKKIEKSNYFEPILKGASAEGRILRQINFVAAFSSIILYLGVGLTQKYADKKDDKKIQDEGLIFEDVNIFNEFVLGLLGKAVKSISKNTEEKIRKMRKSGFPLTIDGLVGTNPKIITKALQNSPEISPAEKISSDILQTINTNTVKFKFDSDENLADSQFLDEVSETLRQPWVQKAISQFIKKIGEKQETMGFKAGQAMQRGVDAVKRTFGGKTTGMDASGQEYIGGDE